MPESLVLHEAVAFAWQGFLFSWKHVLIYVHVFETARTLKDRKYQKSCKWKRRAPKNARRPPDLFSLTWIWKQNLEKWEGMSRCTMSHFNLEKQEMEIAMFPNFCRTPCPPNGMEIWNFSIQPKRNCMDYSNYLLPDTRVPPYWILLFPSHYWLTLTW